MSLLIRYSRANFFPANTNLWRRTNMRTHFTSESVTEGHPDKLCDQVSDAVLDDILSHDPTARVACECAVNTGLLLVMGEITTTSYVDIQKIARDTIRDIGFTGSSMGFDADTCGVIVSIDEQSPDISMGVSDALEGRGTDTRDTGAGDQGMMFGFACNQTPELMPLPISLAHTLTRKLASVHKSGELPFLLPDGKSQVTVEYDDGKPVRIDTIVVSSQHIAEASQKDIHDGIIETVIKPTMPADMLDDKTRILINPTGRFVVGGPHGDSGLTGRKIIVDTYGGYAHHGGGAFSGKDPTKVDRSASYAARYAAKNMVAAGLADALEIQVAYAIGVARPVSIFVNSFGTGKLDDAKLADIVRRTFDLRPSAIIETLNLRRPIYKQTASYGHFGRPDLALPWERLDRVDELREYLK